jgi:hypothetical protein
MSIRPRSPLLGGVVDLFGWRAVFLFRLIPALLPVWPLRRCRRFETQEPELSIWRA